MLSVFSEALDFLKDNLTIVLIAAGALVAVIALIIIIACSVRIHRERARRRAERAERAAEPEMQTDAIPAAKEEAAPAAAVRSVPAAGNVPANGATATAAKAEPSGVPGSPERRAELEKQAELGRVTFIKPRPGMFIRYRYNRSFSAKLIQSEDRVKRYYSELKNCILFDKAQVPHFNYVGDSVLGYKAHLGAGSVTSNLKSDKSLVQIKAEGQVLDTGRKKLGALVGDEAEVGCNSVLCPGSVLGRGCQVYPTSCVRGLVPAGHIFKAPGNLVKRV